MIDKNFETTVPGKWVLSGEHAVLTGAAALALPHPEFRLSLKFVDGGTGLVVSPEDARGVVADVLGALHVPEQNGHLTIESSIPTGAGLGSSAALCVGLTRWIAPQLGVGELSFRDFATRLEDRFHGKSSGMDVAVVQEGRPILYRMGRSPEPVALDRLPHFTFHDTGLRAKTQDCVEQVQRFRRDDPWQGELLDERMNRATQLIVSGLNRFQHDSEGLREVAEGMTLGSHCFEQWGLKPDSVKALEAKLKNEGALATKLTGAGGGGMVVALWGLPKGPAYPIQSEES